MKSMNVTSTYVQRRWFQRSFKIISKSFQHDFKVILTSFKHNFNVVTQSFNLIYLHFSANIMQQRKS